MTEKNWEEYIGNIGLGRKNLGAEMSVEIYRLFQFAMKDTLVEEYGKEEAIQIFRKAGYKAGLRFANEMFDLTLDFYGFIASVQKVMKEMKIGILRLEQADIVNKRMIITIGEDLDCSGLPVTEETACNYDEGFLCGILKAYTNEDFYVRETDCWANGGRVCRFKIYQ